MRPRERGAADRRGGPPIRSDGSARSPDRSRANAPVAPPVDRSSTANVARARVSERAAKQLGRVSESVQLAIGERIAVRIDLEATEAVDEVRTGPAEQLVTRNLDDRALLQVTGWATARGDQENLYPQGLLLSSRAGSPPAQLEKPRTRMPSASRRRISRTADMWSSPGSAPHSANNKTPTSRAGRSRARISGPA